MATSNGEVSEKELKSHDPRPAHAGDVVDRPLPGNHGLATDASNEPATPSPKASSTPPARTRILDVRSSIPPAEDDLQARQRMLSFAARRCGGLIESIRLDWRRNVSCS